MQLEAIDIWRRVVDLTGITLLTYVTGDPNTITEVQDTGSPSDRVVISNRDTFPIREDIIAAYQLLQTQGSLCRSTDLGWLATPQKKTSSIVFRIVGEIAGSDVELTKGSPETLTMRS
jgi:hypothetical protein